MSRKQHKRPKAFLSYSWTNQAHQDQVREWAERLRADGVDVILDLWDLKEGQDTHAFMEQMVTNPEVTHVLVFCDRAYAEKADSRKKGVGTESQIISKEVYGKVSQSKFIPVVCELADDGTPYLPTLLNTRKYIDFSSLEKVNENWEQLIRLLHGRPRYERPALGTPPAYVTEDSAIPSSPARSKYSALRQALLQGKPGVRLYRREFLNACVDYADQLRVRQRPQVEKLGEKVLEDCGKLVSARDHITDWVLLESEVAPTTDFSEALIETLERLYELKSRPAEVNEWSDAWFEAHGLFVYETFLYIVAALLKTRAFGDLRSIFTSSYQIPSTARSAEGCFDRFGAFYQHSDTLNDVLAPTGRPLLSPAAELLRRQAQRHDIPFTDLIQADVLAWMTSCIPPGTLWFPQTFYYAHNAEMFPFFIRAGQHKGFKNLAAITGIEDAEELRRMVKKEHGGAQRPFGFRTRWTLWAFLNMDNLDSIE